MIKRARRFLNHLGRRLLGSFQPVVRGGRIVKIDFDDQGGYIRPDHGGKWVRFRLTEFRRTSIGDRQHMFRPTRRRPRLHEDDRVVYVAVESGAGPIATHWGLKPRSGHTRYHRPHPLHRNIAGRLYAEKVRRIG